MGNHLLKCHDEKQVLKALIVWCCHDKQKRMEKLKPMAFRCIRFVSLNAKDIDEVLQEVEEENATDSQLTMEEKREVKTILKDLFYAPLLRSTKIPSGRLNRSEMDGMLAFVETKESRQSDETPTAFFFTLKDDKGNLLRRPIVDQ